eukprot:16629-Heterococcus_DN1.PRE.4
MHSRAAACSVQQLRSSVLLPLAAERVIQTSRLGACTAAAAAAAAVAEAAVVWHACSGAVMCSVRSACCVECSRHAPAVAAAAGTAVLCNAHYAGRTA